MLNKLDLKDIKSLAEDLIAEVDMCILSINEKSVEEIKEIFKALDEIINEKKHTIERMF